jgi:hypothetical protein
MKTGIEPRQETTDAFLGERSTLSIWRLTEGTARYERRVNRRREVSVFSDNLKQEE